MEQTTSRRYYSKNRFGKKRGRYHSRMNKEGNFEEDIINALPESTFMEIEKINEMSIPGNINQEEFNEFQNEIYNSQLLLATDDKAAEQITNNEVIAGGLIGTSNSNNDDMTELLIPRICPGFDILKCYFDRSNCIYNTLKNFEQHKRKQFKYIVPPDTPIFLGSSINQATFSRIVSSTTLQLKLTKKQTNGIYKMFKILLPDKDSSIPISISKDGQRVRSFLEQYYDSSSNGKCDSICLSFNICMCGETIFVGDYANIYQCLQCSGYRYNRCSICHSDGECLHKSKRTPVKLLQYRPLIRIIEELVKFDNFHKCLNYISDDMEDGKITDILDGEEAKLHLSEMKQKASVFANNNVGRNTKFVNLLLSAGYDGAQVRKKRHVKFYPLLLSIINLPPELRKVNGVGTFLLSIITDREGSKVEDFIFRDCLVEELLALYNGVTMIVNDEEYFIQARLILHVYDTKAMEKLFRFRSVGSSNYCPICRLVFGSTRANLGRVIFDGHRYLLGLFHALRSKGQSTCCCPKNYYTSPTKYQKLRDASDADKERTQDLIDSFNSVGVGNVSVSLFQSCSLSKAEEKMVRAYLNQSEGYEWYHEIDFIKFSKHIYYQHADYRPFQHYERVSNLEYLQQGTLAKQVGGDINGLYGVWPFAALPYSDFKRMAGWDFFHSAKNCCGYLCMLMKNERKFSPATKRYCKETSSHPGLFLHDEMAVRKKQHSKKNTKRKAKKSKHQESDDQNTQQEEKKQEEKKKRKENPRTPYCLNGATINALDDGIAAVLFPSNYVRDNKFEKPFQYFSYLQGIPTIKLFTNFIWLIIIIIQLQMGKTYSTAYLAFLATFSKDLCLLQSPSFTEEEINNLYKRVVELVSLQNGLFPVSESRFVWHQLVDIVPFVRQFGPLRGSWTLGTERAIAQLKMHISNGGRSYFVTVMNRYAPVEFERLRCFYSASPAVSDGGKYEENNIERTFNDMVNKNMFLYIDPRSSVLHHSEHRILLKQKTRRVYVLSLLERHSLLLVMITEILKYFNGNLLLAIRYSSLCRLYIWCIIIRKKQIFKPASPYFFSEFLAAIVDPQIIPILKEKNIILDDIEIIEIENDQTVYNRIMNDGVISALDIANAKQYLDCSSKLVVYRNSCIRGQRFSSRGYECAEDRLPIAFIPRYGSESTIQPRLDANDLRKNVFNKLHYSSWFQFRNYLINTGEQTTNAIERFEDCVGQFNFFSRFSCTMEPWINNCPIGCSTTRKSNYLKVRFEREHTTDIISIDCNHERRNLLLHQPSVNCPILFVALSDVYSNPLAIVPAAADNRPIARHEIHPPKTFNNIAKILLIGLSPERKGLVYQSRLVKLYNENSFDDGYETSQSSMLNHYHDTTTTNVFSEKEVEEMPKPIGGANSSTRMMLEPLGTAENSLLDDCFDNDEEGDDISEGEDDDEECNLLSNDSFGSNNERIFEDVEEEEYEEDDASDDCISNDSLSSQNLLIDVVDDDYN